MTRTCQEPPSSIVSSAGGVASSLPGQNGHGRVSSRSSKRARGANAEGRGNQLWENTPGLASGTGPYVHGSGSAVGVEVYETQEQVGGSADLTYTVGDNLYASVNGLLTNRIEDAYQYNVAGQNDLKFVTLVGVVKVVPDATNPWLTLDMRI